ncbi:MAG TPA: tetratricopeptide repeat protein [Xanthobacteraceae bacterium]|nr:tetratricopeptide repeat protein [Xanthobacteraceae bacterium]
MSRLPLAPAPSGPANPADLFMQAVMHYRQGDHAGARRQLKAVLRKAPRHFEALHLMGLLEAQRGHYKDADKLLRQALMLNPQSAEAHSNRGNVLRELGEFETAVACYDAALRLNPNYPNAHNNRAIALTRLGRLDDAIESYNAALKLDAKFAAAYYNRGMARAQQKRFEDAIADYDLALSLEPGMMMAHIDRANALVELGRFDDGYAAYKRALTIDPNSAAVHFNLGLAQARQDQHEDALASFDSAVAGDPAFAEAQDARANTLMTLGRTEDALVGYDQAIKAAPVSASFLNNRGLALQKLHRLKDALASFDAAVRINPKFAAAHANRAQALALLGRATEASASFERAVAADPSSIDLRANRGNIAMTARQFEKAAEDFAFVLAADRDYPYAVGNLVHCKMQYCDWAGYRENLATIEAGLSAGRRVALPFIAVTLTNDTRLHLQAAQTRAADLALSVAPMRQAEPYKHDRIRIAYSSADFREHPVAFLIAGMLEAHDRSRFEVTAISHGPADSSELRRRIEASVERFVDARTYSDQQIADLIRRSETDIAVDLSGLTTGERAGILVQRPAPVQISFLGYLSTMGASHIDYIIGDPIVIPQEYRSHYSENVVYLPNCFQPTDRSRQIAEKSFSRSDVGLPTAGFVFCCFNSNYKITPDIFDVWMRILQKVDGSVLWLFSSGATAEHNLRQEAAARGVVPERLVFASSMPLPVHQARLRLADLFLDTSPYNAGATASDTLWAGVPVLTQIGETFVGRMAASVLNSIGLPELITTSSDAYEQVAVALATQPDRLAAIRQRLADNRLTAPLFDTALFTRHLEDAYGAMHARHQAGLAAPGHLVVVP